MPKLWINAGELSGDMQGAALLRALREQSPDLVAVGMGGPSLSGAGQRNLFNVDTLSVMGLMEVLTALPRAFRLLSQIKQEMKRCQPDRVLLIDAPEFHFQVAKIAHSLGIPVTYFIPPKVWAWREYRVRFLRQYVQHILCILPFEPAFYARHEMQVDYVGNPLVDMVNWSELRTIEPVPNQIGLMPGSRRKEVEQLLPMFAEVARSLLRQSRPLNFHCLRAPNMSEAFLRSLWPSDIPLQFDLPEDRYKAMRRCLCILAASGTATLETALAGVPTLVAYKVSAVSAAVGRRLIRVPWVSLPNLILNRELFPEFLQEKAHPSFIVPCLSQWLDAPSALESIRSDLNELRVRCGDPGSATRAATLVLESMKST